MITSFYYSLLCIPIYLFCINFKLKEHKYIKFLIPIYFIATLLSIGYIEYLESFGDVVCCGYFRYIEYINYNIYDAEMITIFICTIIPFILYLYWSKNNNKKGLLVWTKILLTIDLVYWLWLTLRFWMWLAFYHHKTPQKLIKLLGCYYF